MKDRPKLLFLIPKLETGGSEKVLSILLNYISKDKFDISLVVLTGTGIFYEGVPASVTKINLHTSRVRYSGFKIYRLIKQANPDMVFVFDVNNLSLIVGLLSFFIPARIKLITREATILSVFIDSYSYLKKLRRSLYKFIFKRFHLIICQSNFMKDDLLTHFNVSENKIFVINNPVEIDKLIQVSSESDPLPKKDTLHLLAVGRLVRVKGFDRIIQALSLIKTSDFHLTFLGGSTEEDPEFHQKLVRLVHQHQLTKKVSFLGFTANPYTFMIQSNVLIISSHYEGFPNVALEANALGLPVLAFNCPGGIGEIIQEGVNGWLIENGNIQQLAAAIDKISTSQINKKVIAEYARGKYDITKIIPLYEKAILSHSV